MGFKFVPYSQIVCGQVAETGVISLAAPNGGGISTTFTSVNFASYGTPNGGCGAYSFGGCHAGSSFGVIQSRALGTTAFSVVANNATFGDPCYLTPKRLYVQLTASGTQAVFVPVPTLVSFTATPTVQDSGIDGIPNYNTTLSWSVSNAVSVTITSSLGESFTGLNFTSGNLVITNLPQSVAGSNSPATITYTLTALNEINESATSSVTVSVYNDNTPDNFTIPDQINVEPSTLTTIIFGPISGIDMRTSITAGPGAEVSNNNINWSNSVLIQNNQTCYVRAFSPPFNTDANGLTNSSTYFVIVGTVQRFFTITTRAPDVAETFNYSNKEDYVPTPDIDTIPDPNADITNQANPYIVSDTLLIDDVELANPNGVEIKVDNPNAQVRVKRSGQSTFGPWEDVRSI
jgi:hypothetical protein